MAYTPELSQIGSATLRRLAWFRGKSMTKSQEMLIGLTVIKMAEVKSGEVCSKCRDNCICKICPFHRMPSSKRQKHNYNRILVR